MKRMAIILTAVVMTVQASVVLSADNQVNEILKRQLKVETELSSLQSLMMLSCFQIHQELIQFKRVEMGLTAVREFEQSGQVFQVVDPAEESGSLEWEMSAAISEVPLYALYSAIDLGGYADNEPPYEPSNPVPANGQSDTEYSLMLQWTGGDPNPEDTLTYDVYFGSTTPPPLVQSDLAVTSYSVSDLTPGTTFYWQVIARDNWDAETASPIWYFTTRVNNAPYTPVNPIPQDGSTDVDVNANLSWQCNDPDPGDTLRFDVYFGTGGNPPLVQSDLVDFTYDPGTLANGTMYYWKIVARDDAGAETAGPVWSFTSMSSGTNNPPYKPGSPTPSNGATGVYIDLDLIWTGGDPDAGDSVMYDVYFGMDSPPGMVAQNISGTTYDPGTMSESTTYYWQIVARDSHQAETAGDIWSFTTGFSSDPTPTPSPEPCTGYGVTLEMGSEYFCPGDLCYLRAELCNPENPQYLPLFVILDVYGMYWFAPSWNQSADYYMEVIPAGGSMKEIIPPFTWPNVSGNAANLVFWGAITDAGMSQILGDYDMYVFGYGACQ